jgi:hypothetical protein
MPAPQVRLSAADIRIRFNAGRYAERAADDTDPSVTIVEILDNGPAPAWAPQGARSQMLVFQDEHGMTIAWAHQYGHPDGKPIRTRRGQSRPDPKFLFEDGTRYKHDPKLDRPNTR